jgi:branched-subunit amino acid transport protein AzlD
MENRILFLIIIMAFITFFTRVLPFILFKNKKLPELLLYLEINIPPIIMLLLVLYCIKDVSLIKSPYGLPEIISISIVILLHILGKNVLISIFGGTLCFMILNKFLVNLL